ncbi:GNAT family N-acetyltransferase [Pontimicrobium sp. SW4]|uniref:GNAT family N-acetyltransferase n=1 Tax=Pontimicrobium sp. SW4 TaxID=3153519 RepID=A0AAU7BSZ3_9FLAO
MIEISSDKSKLDIDIIHNFLTNAYWSKGRTRKEVEKSIKHCLCFGVYKENMQIGFARIATDYVVFAYLMDVFILPEHRGHGYSKKLIEAINNCDQLKSCKVWMLKTSDAHNLYKRFGYKELSYPDKVMERILK